MATSSGISDTAAKEEVRRRSIKNEKSVEGGGRGLTVGLNKHRTFIQDTAVHVHCDTRRQL